MLRTNFPKAGEEYLGGESDGWEYKTSFTGTTVKDAFTMLRKFLEEEGYENIPLPKDVKELLFFLEKTEKTPQLYYHCADCLIPDAGAPDVDGARGNHCAKPYGYHCAI